MKNFRKFSWLQDVWKIIKMCYIVNSFLFFLLIAIFFAVFILANCQQQKKSEFGNMSKSQASDLFIDICVIFFWFFMVYVLRTLQMKNFHKICDDLWKFVKYCWFCICIHQFVCVLQSLKVVLKCVRID